LDAPNLRDDFYCSVLAYSPSSKTLAVGLNNLLYGWSETRGVRLLNAGVDPDCYLTSLSFSSTEGCKSILAFGRSDSTLGLMSLYDDPDPANSRTAPRPRFEVVQPSSIACVSWRPVCTVRPSKNWNNPGIPVRNEDLLVGDETGLIYYYAVEWPERWEVERDNWSGEMTLLARIAVHSQQICGLAWSKSGNAFGTGGNDNLCYLFEADKINTRAAAKEHVEEGVAEASTSAQAQRVSEGSFAGTEIFSRRAPHHPVVHLLPDDAKHRWVHGAAVKAIAFCPWQDTLVATGGGSNDKCIHFFHTGSGAALASISVSAQVTSLIWSTTRREIAATFGYALPDHPVRIAVFSWPECRQVAAIPWPSEHRALYAIAYPGGPAEGVRSAGDTRGVPKRNRIAKEGCIIVASSDKSVKFHEVWSADKKGTAGTAGVLGGSPILEFLEGIEREGEVIR
jgi:WD40 repeat protein